MALNYFCGAVNMFLPVWEIDILNSNGLNGGEMSFQGGNQKYYGGGGFAFVHGEA